MAEPGGDPRADLLGTLHEVSNALTVLLGWVAEARDADAAPEEVAHALAIVEKRARVARDLARRAIGAKVPPPGDADLERVLADSIEALAVEASRAVVALRRQGAAGARVTLGDDVGQIVTNLVLNAIHHAPRESEIRIVTAIEPAAVTIDVEDDGPGVPAERRASVFEGDTTRRGGAGIGLRHARAMARAAGGDLTLLPGPGGARFRLVWPNADAPAVATDAGPPSGRLSRPRLQVLAGTRVLIVEDDTDVTELLGTALEARGAEVTIARTAEELRGRIDEGLHAVLVDLSPIAGDVHGALAMVKQRAAGAEIVFITGSAEALPEGMESAAWVRKPFEVGEVVDAILARKRR